MMNSLSRRFALFLLISATSAFAGTAAENERFIQRQLGDLFVAPGSWGMAPIRTQYNYEVDEAKHTIVIRATGVKTDEGADGMLAFQARELARPDNFCAVGPHYVIDLEGKVYGCRGLGYKPSVSFPNTGVIGVTLMGNFQESSAVAPSMKAEISLIKLLGLLSFVYNIDVNSHIVAASKRNAPKLSDMPGRLVTDMLPRILKEVALDKADLARLVNEGELNMEVESL